MSYEDEHAETVVYFLGDVYLPHPVAVEDQIPYPLIYNLEAPLTSATHGWPATVNLRCEEDHSLATFGKRATAVCLANNHIMDFGVRGLLDTVQHLEQVGVAHFGAGKPTDNCGNPLLLSVGRHQLALLGYVCPTTHPVFARAPDQPGVSKIEVGQIRSDVRRARERGATRIVVCLHWGMEEIQLPRPQDVVLARAVAEMGVDLVIGHHAHCIQPFEVHTGVPIFYGLGNAIFPDIQTWSNYDDRGHPGEPYRKKQNYWNRQSLAVAYNLDTGAFRVDRWASDEKTMRMLRVGVDSPRLAYEPATFSARFKRHRFAAVWRMKLVNFVRSPRLPRPRHLRSLLNILREARSSEDEHR